jgi:putative ABC transport system permease protein
MRLLQGRTLAATDVHGTPPVTVINATMAKRFFKDANPLGKRILVQEIVPGKTQLGEEIPWEVVGVVADEKVGGLDNLSESPGMYVTVERSPNFGPSVLIRSATDTGLLREAVKKAIHEINPDQTLPGMRTLEAIKTDSLGPNRFRALLLATFAGLSLVLAAIGIYGVISYSMSQRTREIGIRVALGASRGNILRLVLRQGLSLTLLGLVVGIGGALGLTRVLASMLFGVTGHDPLTMGVVAAVLGLVALLACLLPARKATRVDPVIALRTE